MITVEFLAFPLGVLAMALLFWVTAGGPQKVAAERRMTAEANALAEEARLEQKRLDRDRELS